MYAHAHSKASYSILAMSFIPNHTIPKPTTAVKGISDSQSLNLAVLFLGFASAFLLVIQKALAKIARDLRKSIIGKDGGR
jgi:hypothetical protein